MADDATADDDNVEMKLTAAENLDFSVEERFLLNRMPVVKLNLSYDSQQIQSEITLTCFVHFGYNLNLPVNEKDRIIAFEHVCWQKCLSRGAEKYFFAQPSHSG